MLRAVLPVVVLRQCDTAAPCAAHTHTAGAPDRASYCYATLDGWSFVCDSCARLALRRGVAQRAQETV